MRKELRDILFIMDARGEQHAPHQEDEEEDGHQPTLPLQVIIYRFKESYHDEGVDE